MRNENETNRDKLLQRGWEKRFTASDPRLREAVELYESMGYEVLVLRATPEDLKEAECDACLGSETLKTIYTRKSVEG
ncbi:MAG: hypothetical protein ACE5JA_00085 [bacterium]